MFSQLVMLYKVQPGVCWKSFGIPVARSAHFPTSVLQVAQHKLDELERYITIPSGSSHDNNSRRSNASSATDEEPAYKKLRTQWENREEALRDLAGSTNASSASSWTYNSPASVVDEHIQLWLNKHKETCGV
jgi:DNA mismatch repair ATPase MutS